MKLWRKNKKVSTVNEEDLNGNLSTDLGSEENTVDSSDMWKDAEEAAAVEEGKMSKKTEKKDFHKGEDPQSQKEGNNKKEAVNDKAYEALKADFESKDLQLKRMVADFENFRRRQSTEREEFLKMASKDLLMDLLPVLDNFERAINASRDATEVSSVIAGIELIQKQLLEAMKKNGLEAIEALDNPFDPNYHEAVQQIVNDEREDQTVINELQKGYTLNGKVLRPSMVVVSTVSD